MSTYVFLGPTLAVDVARERLPDAVILPPAAMGDVYALVERARPRVIGIVDGLFEQRPAVWHKEILYAISQGVRVVGASSMGALRAAELADFGMVGVGRVFEAYRAGELEDDDEVAVAHGPADTGYRAVSEAMVNLRDGLRRAQDRGVISPGTAARLTASAKATFYVERSWGRLFGEGASIGVAAAELDALRAFVRDERPNAKRDDALELLAYIARLAPDAPAPAPTFVLERTVFFEQMARTTTARRIREGAPGADADGAALWRTVSVSPRREAVFRACALLYLLALDARTNAGAASPEQLRGAAARFRRERGLTSAATTREWLARNGVSEHEFGEIVRLEAAVDAMFRPGSAGRGAFMAMLPLALKREGLFGALTARLEARRARGSASAPLDLRSTTAVEALRWYQATVRTIGGSVEQHARELGFEDEADLLGEIIAAFEESRGEAARGG